MTCATLEREAPTTPATTPAPPLVVYGDFNCPWSYLASRRVGVLAAAGVPVEWRAVEHDRRPPGARTRPDAAIAALQEEMGRVLAALLPDERLPYDLAGFVPPTEAAVTAYAESVVARRPARVRRLLFESFWMHGIDIGDPAVLRTLLVDELRGSASPSVPVRDWGYGVDVNGGPFTTRAWRVVRRWSAEWRETGKPVVPVVMLAEPLHGVDAVEWLGRQVRRRGLDPEPPAHRPVPRGDRRELPSLGWVSANGGRWLARRQQSVANPRRTSA